MDETIQALFALTSEWNNVKRKIADLIAAEENSTDPEEIARLQRERADLEVRETALNHEMKQAQAERRRQS